jgi:hypothetical protein
VKPGRHGAARRRRRKRTPVPADVGVEGQLATLDPEQSQRPYEGAVVADQEIAGVE